MRINYFSDIKNFLYYAVITIALSHSISSQPVESENTVFESIRNEIQNNHLQIASEMIEKSRDRFGNDPLFEFIEVQYWIAKGKDCYLKGELDCARLYFLKVNQVWPDYHIPPDLFVKGNTDQNAGNSISKSNSNIISKCPTVTELKFPTEAICSPKDVSYVPIQMPNEYFGISLFNWFLILFGLQTFIFILFMITIYKKLQFLGRRGSK